MKYKILTLVMLSTALVSIVTAMMRTEIGIKTVGAASVTHGDTRVTLLHVARTTSLTKQFVQGPDEQEGRLYAVPGVYVEFLIERTGDKQIECGPHVSSVELWQNGEKVSGIRSVVAGGVGGIRTYSSDIHYFGFEPPAVENIERTRLRYSSKRGIVLKSGEVERR